MKQCRIRKVELVISECSCNGIASDRVSYLSHRNILSQLYVDTTIDTQLNNLRLDGACRFSGTRKQLIRQWSRKIFV